MTMTMVTKPKVFISSTVYDLKDLRSALKFWLQELGYEVMLSEYNDFPKENDKNSYEACLTAITRADFFILIIGNRAGGWFDEAKKISITRMEYRVARAEFDKSGGPKPVVFVRQNLWDVREDRAALNHYLKNIDDKQLSEAEKKQIAKHPSRFADDAEAIFSFLKEVGQVDAMKKATTKGGPLPAANWIHRFDTFRDVVDALRVAFNTKSHIELHVLKTNLVSELTANLSHLLCKGPKGRVGPIADWAMYAVGSIKGGPSDRSTMKGNYAIWLTMFGVMALPVRHRLSTLFVRHAVLSGAFMSHDAGSGAFTPSVLHSSLLELMTLVERLQSSLLAEPNILEFGEKMKTYGRDRNAQVSIPNILLAMPCLEAKIFARLTDLSKRCLCSFLGDTRSFENMESWSPSIFPDETAKISEETVTSDEVRKWAAGG